MPRQNNKKKQISKKVLKLNFDIANNKVYKVEAI